MEAEDLDLLGPAKIVFERNNDGHIALLTMAAEIGASADNRRFLRINRAVRAKREDRQERLRGIVTPGR